MALSDMKNKGTDPLQLMRQLQSDTGNMLQQAGKNVPTHLQGNAGAIIQHLLQTGQITQASLMEAQKKAAQFMGRK